MVDVEWIKSMFMKMFFTVYFLLNHEISVCNKEISWRDLIMEIERKRELTKLNLKVASVVAILGPKAVW